MTVIGLFTFEVLSLKGEEKNRSVRLLIPSENFFRNNIKKKLGKSISEVTIELMFEKAMQVIKGKK